MKAKELTERVDRIHALVHDPELGNYSHAIALGQQVSEFIEAWQRTEAREMLTAIVLRGWEVERRSLYDEEGVEGWAWIEPDGTEHVETGNWNELPPWPDSAREALAEAVKP